MEKLPSAFTPQQLETEGGALYQKGDYSAAAMTFAAAEKGYQQKGDELKAAEMANNRSVALLKADQPEAAVQAVADTIALFQAAGDERRQGLALGNRAAALEGLGQLDAAIADYELSAALLKNIGADDLRLDVLKSLSALQLRTGRSLQAVATMQAGIDGLEKPDLKQRFLKKLLGLPARLIK